METKYDQAHKRAYNLRESGKSAVIPVKAALAILTTLDHRPMPRAVVGELNRADEALKKARKIIRDAKKKNPAAPGAEGE